MRDTSIRRRSYRIVVVGLLLFFCGLQFATMQRIKACMSSSSTSTRATFQSFMSQPAPPRGAASSKNMLSGVKGYPDKSVFPSACFERQDESDDRLFYAQPRFVYHVDDRAHVSLTNFYAKVLPETSTDHLDICSSWVSFLPKEYKPKRCVGLGMVREELDANDQLSSAVVQDLNASPVLPFESDTFDALTCVVSIDYLAQPFEVMEEAMRVLRPGGVAIVSFSNRAFWTKAVRVWVEASEWQRILLVAAYLNHAGFEDIEATNLTAGERGDPMYVVMGRVPDRPVPGPLRSDL